MAGRTYLELGDWNAACSMCGQKRKASELIKNWQGLYRCPEHNEPRHAQDFVRASADTQAVTWAQPRPPAYNLVSCLNGSSGSVTPDGTTTVILIDESTTLAMLTINAPSVTLTTLIIRNFGVVAALTNNSGVVPTVINYGSWL